ncbi:DEAD/DEAH box helicase [Streptomyces sp. f51]|uniref:DEAD/DEAH box helicase n=1 Tax=Streptomyces sp. f51 TaxID=1827742 RepID=UPI000BF14875|nr:DEAD/DEAH box helicase [Streptomyces sp. f51]
MQQTPQANGSGITLRPHQAEAVDRIVSGLSLPASGTMPAGGLRGQVHMATGTGKTITAAIAALRLCPNGMIGVLVPTVDLLTQTIEAWRTVGHNGPAVAVCGPGPDALLEALGARRTTNPTQLALWASKGPMLVIATYASLAGQGLEDDQGDTPDTAAPGVLERALRGSYGQKMGPFDLLVVDEAHHTSGDGSKAWAGIHDQARFPAARRLYMTATPRLWEAAPRTTEEEADGDQPGTADAPDAGEVLGGRLIASMDDTTLYGPVLHETGLMESVERGILARFEVDVLEIRDPSPIEEDASLEERRGRRLAALQAALLKHADETGTRSYMTFHSRTLDAMAFSRVMPETAARLHAADPAAYPARVGAEWLSGEHAATHRRDVLTRYADGLDAEGWVTELGFLASCRVLGEGVDIRGTRGVGAVVFADTRSSPVEIVQIIGRALRQEPGDGKVSRILVPVFLEPGEDPSDMMASSSYTGLVAILQGLRAHDDRVIQRMALPTTTARGQITSVLALDPQQQTPADENDDQFAEQHGEDEGQEQDGEREPAAAGTEDDGVEEGEEDQDDEDEGDASPGIAPVTTPLLRFSLPRDPEAVALFLRTRVLRPDSEIWLTGYNTLRGWAREHGHARVPSEATVKSGDDDGSYALGSWVAEQRRAFKAGTLKAWRVDLLNEVGMVWSVGDTAFWRNLSAARSYYAVHSTLACPRNAVWDGVPLGQWISNLRRPGGLGTDPVRAEERRRALEAIDPEWNPSGWPVDWQRHYSAARVLLAEEQGGVELLPGITVNGVDVGTWTTRQTDPAVWDTLLPEQRERLKALGLTRRTDTTPAATTAAGKSTAFERGITALTQYAAREGRVAVPRTHIEETPHGPVRLGTWISNTRTRRNKLTDQQRAQLAALGIDWATA